METCTLYIDPGLCWKNLTRIVNLNIFLLNYSILFLLEWNPKILNPRTLVAFSA